MNCLQTYFTVTLAGAIGAAQCLSSPGPVVAAVQEFELSQVKLLDGPFKDRQELDAKYLLSLDADRLLHAFRINAGLPSTAEPLGGWEAPNCEVRGHFVGHYLSACAMMYQDTGDERFKTRADYLVAELAKCQQALGGEYLSAYPPSFFDRLEAGKGVWAPYYTIHKIMAGLLDAHLRCGNAHALKVLKGMSAYFKKRTDNLDDAQMAIVMKNEFGGMMEVLANLYAVTGNPDDLALSRRFDHHAVFDPLAAREDHLANLHANTNIPKMTGAARLYELTADERYHTIADYFWEQVTGRRSFVTGGNSFDEHFRRLGVEAGELSPATSETCNTYNMLKLTRHLFQWKPEARYADYYERALYNHILASMDPDSGMMLYFLSLKPGHFKVFNTPLNSFWCCTGTGVENHAKYGDSIYFHDDAGLWVNLFIASELNWPQKGLLIRQETTFPLEQATTLRIKAAKPVQLAVRLRVPYWATSGVTVKLNGQPVDTSAARPESYLLIDRQWADGDKVEMSLPMSLHIYHAADLKDNVAILYGPLVLAGELGQAKMPASVEVRDQSDLGRVPTPAVPVLVSDSEDPNTWLKPVPGKPLTFTTVGAGKPNDVTLTPLYLLNHQRYTVYWKLLRAVAWTEYEKEQKAADEKARAEAARIVDEAGFGNEQTERDHGFQSEKSGTGEFNSRFYRDAAAGGWFSCRLKVLPAVPQTLHCTYWGSDRGREFDVMIDGVKLATESLHDQHPEAFFTVDYTIPAALLAGKSTVTVRFQSHGGHMAGGVFGCAVMRDEH